MSSARSSVLATGGTLVERVRIAEGQTGERAEPVVGLEELGRVADVVASSPATRKP